MLRMCPYTCRLRPGRNSVEPPMAADLSVGKWENFWKWTHPDLLFQHFTYLMQISRSQTSGSDHGGILKRRIRCWGQKMWIPSTRVEKIEHILEMSCLIRFLFIKKQMGNVFKCLEAIRTFLKIVVDLIKCWKMEMEILENEKEKDNQTQKQTKNGKSEKDKNSCYYFVSSVFLIVLSCFCFSLLF